MQLCYLPSSEMNDLRIRLVQENGGRTWRRVCHQPSVLRARSVANDADKIPADWGTVNTKSI